MAKGITNESIYARFGVNEGATTREIEAAYRRLATQWHPSKHPDDKDAQLRFEQLATAFFVVTDSTERNRYIAYLRSGLVTPYRLSQIPTPGEFTYERVVLRHADYLVPHFKARDDLERALRADAIPEPLVQKAVTSIAAKIVKAGEAAPPMQRVASHRSNPPQPMHQAGHPTMPEAGATHTASPATSATLPAGLTYASFWERMAAAFLDSIVLVVLYLLIAALCAVVAGWSGHMLEGAIVANIVALIVGLAYFGPQESSGQRASLGKRALHLHVIDLDGRRVSLLRAVMRHLARYLSALPLLFGYLVQPFTERRQALHDMLSGTVVVRDLAGRSNNTAVTLAIIGGALGLVSTTGVLASITIPKLERFEKLAVIEAAMADAHSAIARLEMIHVAKGRIPAHMQFPHSDAVASVDFDKPAAAVEVKFRNQHGLGNKALVAYPSAQSGKICYVLPGETGHGLDNCPAGEPSALNEAKLN
ncbi:MAG: RDD family protein [Burkholderiales bacterium]|nr:RDD family protein [Burkholderiales bacterium]